MWIVFGATLAAAAFLVRSQRLAHQIKLVPQPTATPGITVHLPLGWRVQHRAAASGEILVADEPGRTGRSLSIYRQTLMRPLSPIEFLASAFGIDLRADQDPSLDDLDAAIEPTSFGKYAGIIMSTEVSIPGHGDQDSRKEVYAAAVLPSGHALAIRLQGVGGLTGGDLGVVDQVARSMTIGGEPSIAPAGQPIALANGMTLKAPPGFQLIENRDPNLTRRRLWYTPVSGATHPHVRWASIELIPCMLPDPDTARVRPQTEVLTMLISRDSGWRGAEVKPQGPHAFSADMPIEQAAIIFPTLRVPDGKSLRHSFAGHHPGFRHGPGELLE